MMNSRVFAAATVAAALFGAPAWAAPADSVSLADGWTLQSSAKLGGATGEKIAAPGFSTEGWYSISVPSTVVAGLVKHKVFPDPYFGMNIRQYPGMSYPLGKNFSKYPMAADSPFAVPWWYRKTFQVPAAWKGKTIWLHFAGINYRANIYVNGRIVANQGEVAGALRTYDFDVTPFVAAGGENVLAVEVWTPKETDLAITFVDWNPAPPDKSMGLWREVTLSASGPVSVQHGSVSTTLTDAAGPSPKAAVTVSALLRNASDKLVKAKVKGRLGSVSFEQPIELGPREQKDIAFEPATFAQLNLKNPRLWWPAQMGAPYLYDLSVRVEVDGKVSDEEKRKVGIREITSGLDGNKKRYFVINGKKILIRGAGWSSDMLLTYDHQRVEDQLKYVQDIGLNTVRLEGKLEPEHFFDLADKMGLLVMAGWCCCDHWEHWDKWKTEDHAIAEQSLRSQILRLRGHASLLVFLNASDFPPPNNVESMYLRVEKELRWPNPTISSATAKPTPVSGESGVKMSGPYEWIPPSYWLEDDKRGGAHGFNSETSPGPAPPPIESLKRMFPPDKLWPQNEVWSFHSGGDVFTNLNVFTAALDARYGKANTVEDFANKSQLMAYEGIRAMFEAYGRNKYTSTGVIQWMLNNAWPGLIWHLYDWYLRPGAGYFGAKIAVEKVHPLYSYPDRAIWVVNSAYEAQKGLKVTAKVLNLDMTEKFAQTAPAELAPDGTLKVIDIPEIAGLDPTYFIHLTVADARGKTVGSNLYWMSTKKDVLDWDKSQWYYTPTKSYADFTALAKLPKVKVDVKAATAKKGADNVTSVTLSNPSKSLAFFIRLKVNQGKGGEEVLPVRWQDNYLSLLPGEKRTVTATYRAADLGGKAPAVEVSGYNVVAE
jgi:exo-1,4-beta-D-glucosaminidase